MDRKGIVRRWVDEVINEGRFDALDELCTQGAAERTLRWVPPFRESFPDVQMKEVELVAEGETVAGRFTCSGTHSGQWGDHTPTGRRFEGVPEVYFFDFEAGRIAGWWALEDNLSRMRQLQLPI